jgi:hypothetical protein
LLFNTVESLTHAVELRITPLAIEVDPSRTAVDTTLKVCIEFKKEFPKDETKFPILKKDARLILLAAKISPLVELVLWILTEPPTETTGPSIKVEESVERARFATHLPDVDKLFPRLVAPKQLEFDPTVSDPLTEWELITGVDSIPAIEAFTPTQIESRTERVPDICALLHTEVEDPQVFPTALTREPPNNPFPASDIDEPPSETDDPTLNVVLITAFAPTVREAPEAIHELALIDDSELVGPVIWTPEPSLAKPNNEQDDPTLKNDLNEILLPKLVCPETETSLVPSLTLEEVLKSRPTRSPPVTDKLDPKKLGFWAETFEAAGK